MTLRDVNALQAEPTAEAIEAAWAVDFVHQFGLMSERGQRTTWNALTDDERDILREYVRLAFIQLRARLAWVAANIDTILPSSVAA